MATTKFTLVRNTSKTTPRAAKSSDERIFKRLRWAPAYITNDVLHQLENELSEDGPLRRLALATLARSGAELIQSIETDRGNAVAFAELADSLGDYAERLTKFVEMLNTATARIRLALCVRDDIDSVIAEACHD